MKVRVYRNRPRTLTWRIGHLPVRQTLVWAGPLFILIQERQR